MAHHRAVQQTASTGRSPTRLVFNSHPQRRSSSYGDAPVGGSPEHAAMYRRILAALEAPAEINGYGEPEDLWCKLISEHGHFSFHFGFNWTFHAKAPYRGGAFRQRGAVTVETAEIDPEKYQVVFMLSEGEWVRCPSSGWFDPDRLIPFNWGSILMAERFMAMLDYYYRTAIQRLLLRRLPQGLLLSRSHAHV